MCTQKLALNILQQFRPESSKESPVFASFEAIHSWRPASHCWRPPYTFGTVIASPEYCSHSTSVLRLVKGGSFLVHNTRNCCYTDTDSFQVQASSQGLGQIQSWCFLVPGPWSPIPPPPQWPTQGRSSWSWPLSPPHPDLSYTPLSQEVTLSDVAKMIYPSKGGSQVNPRYHVSTFLNQAVALRWFFFFFILV